MNESLKERLQFFKNDATCVRLLHELRSRFGNRDLQISAMDLHKNDDPVYVAYLVYGVTMDELLEIGNILKPGYQHRVGDDTCDDMPFELLNSAKKVTTTDYRIDLTDLEV